MIAKQLSKLKGPVQGNFWWYAALLFIKENGHVEPKISCTVATQYFHNGKQDLAFEIVREVITKFPRNEVAPTMLAQYLWQSGKEDESIAQLRENITKFPNDEVAPTMLAQYLWQSGKKDESIAQLRENIAKFPRNEVAPTMLAQYLWQSGNGDEAYRLLEKPNQVGLKVKAGMLFQDKNLPELLKTFTQITDLPWALSFLTVTAKCGVGVNEHKMLLQIAGREGIGTSPFVVDYDATPEDISKANPPIITAADLVKMQTNALFNGLGAKPVNATAARVVGLHASGAERF